MNACLAILAHEGAEHTVRDFMPRWKALGIPVIGCYPEDEAPAPVAWDGTVMAGKSAHAGREVFRRFTETCDILADLDHDLFVIAEYDTVNLGTALPTWAPGTVSSYLVGVDGQSAHCMLSPWVMDKATLEMLVADMQVVLRKDPDCPESKGLLDRWLGIVCERQMQDVRMCANCLGYPWHAGAHDRIRRMGIQWVHGWKTKEDFGDLWTQ